MFVVEDLGDRVRFSVKVQPRASKTELAGLYQNMAKLRITAPPVDGEANKACVEYFAKALGVPKSNVHLVSGTKGRTKTFEVEGITVAKVRALIKT